MGRIVGMNRTIKLEWLNETADLVLQGFDEAEIRLKLQEYLSFEIKSPVVLKNTRTILLQTWVYIPNEFCDIKNKALKLFVNSGVDRVIAHWCMMLLAYPLMVDICGYIGKATKIQDYFSVAWLKEKLNENWGERTTISDSISKILQTFRQLHVIDKIKTGVYIAKIQSIEETEAISLMVQTVLALKLKAYYEIDEISLTPQMFPFRYKVTHEILNASEDFTLSHFGGKTVLL